MSKKPAGKIKLTPIKPLDAIKKIKKNGWREKNKDGPYWVYSKIADGKEELVIIHMHPTEELGIPYVKHIIKKTGKTNDEWVNL